MPDPDLAEFVGCSCGPLFTCGLCLENAAKRDGLLHIEAARALLGAAR